MARKAGIEDYLQMMLGPQPKQHMAKTAADMLFGGVAQAPPADAPLMDRAMHALAQPGVMPVGMTAWHGTPHKFAPTPKNPYGEFDLSKIGTGEGAQAYGHGAYLAEDPSVASYYLRKPAISQEISASIGKVADDEALGAADALKTWRGMGKVWEGGRPTPEEIAYFNKTPRGRGYVKMADAILEGRVPSERPSGTMYKVDLPDEAVGRMLDWDAPLSRDVLDRLTPEAMGLKWKQHGNYGGFVNAQNRPIGPMFKGVTAEQARAKWAHELARSTTGQQFYQRLGLTKPEASEALRNAGIPGIKYFDQGSRGAGKGTRNFVVWDTDLLKILGAE